MHALIIDGQIVKVGGLPGSARLLSSGDWLCPPGGLIEATQEQRESCGWFDVVDTPRPADTAQNTHDHAGVQLVAGKPTVVWTQRAWTAGELAAQATQTNGITVRDRAAQALVINATFLAKASPTNLETVAHVKALTRQMNGLIRMTIGQLDSITDS